MEFLNPFITQRNMNFITKMIIDSGTCEIEEDYIFEYSTTYGTSAT